MTQHYTLHLSSKQTIILDEDDFQKFSQLGEKGTLIRLKQAIINPSFVVAIVPLKVELQKKVEGHIDETSGKYVIDSEEESIPEIEDKFSSVLRLE